MPILSYLRSLAAALAALLLFAASPAAALDSAALDSPELLDAGEYVWAPERSPDGPVEIVVGLAEQRAFVFRGGTLVGVSTVSSGKAGHESPIGRFEILQKRRHHRSSRYGDAPMPFMQRLNWYGVAFHGGDVPDRPASHGCIRLPMGFARALYGITGLGTFVFVTEEPLSGPDEALALARANAKAPVPPDRTPEWVRGG